MPATPSILSDDLLHSFHERAPVYDRENRFFAEDFEDLAKAGYLKMAVPKKFGGLGKFGWPPNFPSPPNFGAQPSADLNARPASYQPTLPGFDQPPFAGAPDRQAADPQGYPPPPTAE